MSDTEESTNSSQKRRRRRRRKRGSSNDQPQRNGKQNSGGGNRSRTPSEKFGGRDPVADAPSRRGPAPLNAFELFCAYHLGITDDNRYSRPSMKDVTRRFDRTQKEIQRILHKCGLDKGSLRECGFDISLAQLDIRVAPDGIDKREIARTHFEEFVDMNPNFMEWEESDDEDWSADEEE